MQLVLDLPPTSDSPWKGFVAGAANQAALSWLRTWPHWPSYGLVLHGPPCSGKTHLGRLWQEMSGAQELTPLDQDTSPEAWKEKPILIDNLSETTWQEEWLFHFLNARHSCVAGLLIADRRAPSAWSFAKADVVSRCRALPSVSLEEPDESLVEALLKELFHRRGVTLSQEVARFLSFRVERRYTAVLHLVERLNGQSLQQRRPITVPFLRAFREFSA
ncbi:MAG: hypothetical protein LBD66_01175 [Holosporales bacterium]|nr:hypothetical protein [Holosporales bacterium]